MKRLLFALVFLGWATAQSQEIPDSWPGVLEKAKGQTVYFNAWAGDENTNAFIAWVGQRVRDRARHRTQARENHAHLGGRCASGRRKGRRPAHGRVDRFDLDQRGELPRDEGAGAALRALHPAAAQHVPGGHGRQTHHRHRLHRAGGRPGVALADGAGRLCL